MLSFEEIGRSRNAFIVSVYRVIIAISGAMLKITKPNPLKTVLSDLPLKCLHLSCPSRYTTLVYRRNSTLEANGVIQVKANKVRRMFLLESNEVFMGKTVVTVFLFYFLFSSEQSSTETPLVMFL